MADRPGNASSPLGIAPGYLSDIYTAPMFIYYLPVVWQFWGRAAEASLTEKSGALFLFGSVGLLRARRAISADLQSRHDNAEPAVFLDLRLQLLENIADELHDLAATQARHVDVIAI